MIETRSRLIAAANEQFRRAGYNGTSLKQITEAASATIGSLYHFFPGGKTDLAECVIRETGAAYLELFEAIAAASPSTAAAIDAFFTGAASTLSETGYIDVCPIGTVAREIANTDDRLRAAAHAVFQSWVKAVAMRLRADGLPDETADALAATVVAALEGAFVLARAGRDTTPLISAGGRLARLIQDTVEHLPAAP